MAAPKLSLSLGKTAEYALRAMSRLALLHGGSPARAADLSRDTGVPLPYLLKIMRQLVAAGLVHSAKGHGGGFRLARPPRQIPFLDVLQAAGYGSEPDQCVFGWGECKSDRPCPLHHTWSAANRGFLAWAKAATLADARRPLPEDAGRRRRPLEPGDRAASRAAAPKRRTR